jgi:hypothetical protein
MNGQYEFRGVRIGAVVAVVAAAAVLVWYFAIRDTGSSEPASTSAGGNTILPVETTQTNLSSLSHRLGQPIYWAGPQPDTKLEISRTANAATYVRYLPTSAAIGEREKGYLTVVTFPFPDAYGALQAVAKKPGRIVDHVPGNGLVVTIKGSPHVYVAFPKVNYQIEVYDPDASRALSIAASGDVRPIR